MMMKRMMLIKDEDHANEADDANMKLVVTHATELIYRGEASSSS